MVGQGVISASAQPLPREFRVYRKSQAANGNRRANCRRRFCPACRRFCVKNPIPLHHMFDTQVRPPCYIAELPDAPRRQASAGKSGGLLASSGYPHVALFAPHPGGEIAVA
jgi:dihydrodipicolinate synthase/N-acetylneuraminate lyase